MKLQYFTVGKEISSRVKVSLEHMAGNEVEKRYGLRIHEKVSDVSKFDIFVSMY